MSFVVLRRVLIIKAIVLNMDNIEEILFFFWVHVNQRGRQEQQCK